MDKKDTWTLTVEMTVFAGDMDKEDVIKTAERLLEDMIDGTDLVSFRIVDANRDE